jgi:Calcineurin-like phosphoesterase
MGHWKPARFPSGDKQQRALRVTRCVFKGQARKADKSRLNCGPSLSCVCFLQVGEGKAPNQIKANKYPPPIQGRDKILFSWANFLQLRSKFIEVTRNALQSLDAWPIHRDAAELDVLFPSDVLKPAIYPFVSRYQYSPNTEVAVFGDIHGSFPSLLRDIDFLSTPAGGSFFVEDTLKLKPNKALVFCGDYTDRGVYGVESLALLMALRVNNPLPGRVVINRGNHESSIQNEKEQGFGHELLAKYEDQWGAQTDDEFVKVLHFHYNLNLVYSFYSFLPQASFIRVSPATDAEANAGPGTYLLTAHGGVDITNVLMPFMQRPWSRLDGPGGIAAQHATIRYLAQAEWLLSQPKHLNSMMFRNDFPTFREERGLWTSHLSMDAPHTVEMRLGKTISDPSNLNYRTGFLWNDLIQLGDGGGVYLGAEATASSRRGHNPFTPTKQRGLALGKELACDWMTNHGVTAIWRGHQHSDSTEGGFTMESLIANHGLVDMWAAGKNAEPNPHAKCPASSTIFTTLSANSLNGFTGIDSLTRIQLTSSDPAVGKWTASHCWQPNSVAPAAGSQPDPTKACEASIAAFKCEPVTTWAPAAVPAANRISYFTSGLTAYNDAFASSVRGAGARWQPITIPFADKNKEAFRLEIFEEADTRTKARKYGGRVLRARVFKMSLNFHEREAKTEDVINMRMLLRPQGDTLVLNHLNSKAAAEEGERVCAAAGPDYTAALPVYQARQQKLQTAASSNNNAVSRTVPRRRAVLCKDVEAYFKEPAHAGETWYPRQLIGNCDGVDSSLCFCLALQHRPAKSAQIFTLGIVRSKDLVLRIQVRDRQDADALQAALDDAYELADARAAAYDGAGNLRRGRKNVAKGYSAPASVIAAQQQRQQQQQQVLAPQHP